MNVFKIAKGNKFTMDCKFVVYLLYQLAKFHEKVFSAPFICFLWQKIRKLLKVEKIRLYDEERVFFREKKLSSSQKQF